MSICSRRVSQRSALSLAIALAFATHASATTFTWDTGDYLAAGLPNPLGSLDIINAVAGGSKGISTEVINNGQINWATTNTLYFTDGTLRNNGTFDAQADGWLRDFGGTNTVDNAGVLKKSAGTGELQIGTLLINRSGGTLDASAGTIRYTNAGTLEAGTVFAGTGINAFETIGGTYTFTDNFSGATNNVRFDRGTFVSGGVGPVDIRTNLTWAGGLLQGQWVNSAGRTLTAVASAQAKTLTGSLVNDGRINWATTNTLYFVDGTLRNNGTFDAQADGWLRSFGGTNAIENPGLITKSAGNGDFRITTVLNNTGTIESLSGTIVLPNNWQNDGTLRGTAAFQSNVLTNAGNISPGLPDPANAIATLTIKGALTQVSTGFLSLDVTDGGISDLLDITGAVTFGGKLHVNRVGNYVAQVGDIFRVANFSSFTGTLLDIEEFGFANGAQFSAIYSTDHLDIVVSAVAVPEPATYALMASGLLGLWGLKRRRQGATTLA